jgi:hypothetical protein
MSHKAGERLAFAGRGVVQSGQEIFAPVFRKGRRSDRLLQERTIVSLAGKEAVHLLNRNSFFELRNAFNRVSFGDHAFLFDRKVNPAARTPQEPFDHVVPLKLGGQLVAWHARLPDHQNCRPDAESVANVNFILCETYGCEISPNAPQGKSTPGNSLRQNS